MLQALNLDPASRPSTPLDREAGTDLQASAVASYLASAASFAG